MNNIRHCDERDTSYNPNPILRFLALAGVALAMTGCGQLRQLLSNPQVSDADNDQVIFLGDSCTVWQDPG